MENYKSMGFRCYESEGDRQFVTLEGNLKAHEGGGRWELRLIHTDELVWEGTLTELIDLIKGKTFEAGREEAIATVGEWHKPIH